MCTRTGNKRITTDAGQMGQKNGRPGKNGRGGNPSRTAH